MRILSMDECFQIFGGGDNKSQTPQPTPGGGKPTNPMVPGSGSATDQAVDNLRNGNIATAIAQGVFNGPEIIGNGIDGLIHMGRDFFNRVGERMDEFARTPGAPDADGVRRSPDGMHVIIPIE